MTHDSPFPIPDSRPLKIRRLGRQPYAVTWKAMGAFTDNRVADTADEAVAKAKAWVGEQASGEDGYRLGRGGEPEWEKVEEQVDGVAEAYGCDD